MTKSNHYFQVVCHSNLGVKSIHSLQLTLRYIHLHGTEVPRPKLGLDFRPGVELECGTKMPKSELGLGFRVSSATPYFIPLLYTALIGYKSESRSLTNAQQDFSEQQRKANPTYHRMLGSFLGTSLPGICA